MQFKVEINNYQPSVRGAFFDLGEQKQWSALSLGIGSYLVQASLDYGGLRDSTLIGRYCSLARNLNLLVGVNHAPQYVSTYPFRELDWQKDPWNPNHYPEAGGHQILIGNDVWIGFDVTILGGVRIGNGAVIGAGAVVARDVPPYAVVVGNPARVIRYRFTEDVIAKLQKIKWWNWPYEEILRNQALLEDVDAFVARYYQESMTEPVQTELAVELQRLRSAGWCIGYFVPDFAAPKPVWEQVVRQYLSRYQAADRVALLLEVPVAEQQSAELQRLQAMVTAAGEQAPMILRHVDPVFPAVDVLQHIDFYITSREEVSLRCVDFADEYGFRVLYALDTDFWKAVSYDCKN